MVNAMNTILSAVTEGGDPQTSFTLDPPGRRRFFRGRDFSLSPNPSEFKRSIRLHWLRFVSMLVSCSPLAIAFFLYQSSA